MLRFWSSKLHFWRKSRTKASFFSFKASFLKEVSQKSFVFGLQSFNFEGSLAEKFRFGSSKLHFWRRSRTKASSLSFKASILKEVSQKSFVFDLQSFVFEGSLAEKLRLTKPFESHISWQPNHLNLKSFDIQITWISNQLTTNSFESQIDWQPNHLNLRSIDNRITWISDQLTTESLESQINWQPHHLKFKSTDNQNHLKHTSIDNQVIWISNQLTTKSFESQINWQPTSFESQIRWQPNHLTLNSFESDINWLSNQLNSAHPLPIGSLSLETSAAASCGRYVNYIPSGWQSVEQLENLFTVTWKSTKCMGKSSDTTWSDLWSYPFNWLAYQYLNSTCDLRPVELFEELQGTRIDHMSGDPHSSVFWTWTPNRICGNIWKKNAWSIMKLQLSIELKKLEGKLENSFMLMYGLFSKTSLRLIMLQYPGWWWLMYNTYSCPNWKSSWSFARWAKASTRAFAGSYWLHWRHRPWQKVLICSTSTVCTSKQVSLNEKNEGLVISSSN